MRTANDDGASPKRSRGHIPLFLMAAGAWGILAVCSGLLMIETVGLLVVYLTLGLGLVFYVLPTLTVYTAPWLVAYGAWLGRTPWPFALLFGMVLTVGVAVTPGLASRAAGPVLVSALTSEDTPPDAPEGLPETPRVLRFIVPTSGLPSNRRSGSTDCHAPCQHLLYSDAVDAVEMVARTPKGVTQRTVWRRETRPTCPAAFQSDRRATDATRQRLLLGDCLIAFEDETLEDAPWFAFVEATRAARIEADRAPWVAPLVDLAEVRAGRAHTPWASPDVRRTGVSWRRHAMPLIIMPVQFTGTNLAWGPWSHVQRSAILTEAAELQAIFGYDVVEAAVPHGRIADLAGIVHTPADAEPSTQVIEAAEAIVRARQYDATPLDADELAMLTTYLTTPHVPPPTHLTQLLRRHPEGVAPLLPAMVTRLTFPTNKRWGFVHRGIAQEVAKQPLERLTPFADDLLAVVHADPAGYAAPLWAIAPRLGPVDVDALAVALDDPAIRNHQAALRGVCHLETDAAQTLLARVRAYAEQEDGDVTTQALAELVLEAHGQPAPVRGVTPRDRRRKDAKERLSGGSAPSSCPR